ncbi:unnamed protein product [Cyprideis torosa]|uniref:Uncharacterized protein n=1 Tax=Cyprideis torosa TaxID=163714 RepID=A0A7R8W854_9CRUS|nr:unnamed protein product [Cyprideis torosa]CAG0885891.1 unnamed protein product [Cyprideis torosa]
MLPTVVSVLVLLGMSVEGAEECERELSKIVGGEEAKLSDYPFAVSIQQFIIDVLPDIDPELIDKWHHSCGGVILNERFVLTAGHCNSLAMKIFKNRVMAGGLHNMENEAEPSQQFRMVEEVIEHQKYILITDDLGSVKKIENDIMLLRLAEPFDLEAGPEIAAAELPTKEDPFPLFNKESSCTGVGWGLTRPLVFDQEGKSGSPVLLWVNITAFEDEECDRRYAATDSQWAETQPEQVMCAGLREGEEGRGICGGDSGGGLLCEAEDGSKRIFGITSMTAGICSACSELGSETLLTIADFTELSHPHSLILRLIHCLVTDHSPLATSSLSSWVAHQPFTRRNTLRGQVLTEGPEWKTISAGISCWYYCVPYIFDYRLDRCRIHPDSNSRVRVNLGGGGGGVEETGRGKESMGKGRPAGSSVEGDGVEDRTII